MTTGADADGRPVAADPLFDLVGRRIVIVGGASGIGLGVAQGLATRGAALELWDRNEPALAAAADAVLTASGARPRTRVVDIAAAAAVETAAAAAEAIGPVDGLVNCAGITEPRQPVLDISQAAWDRMIAVNLTGSWNTCRALGRAMVARQRGSIVNFASTNAIDPSPGIAHYCVSKAGVAMLTQALALEWAAVGVRVNALGPGPVLTPMTEPILAGNPALREQWEARVPMGRFGTPSDLVGAVVFLLTDASAWMTGRIMYVDGGWLL
ncbi:MAG: SDR family oxidoreductase [Thermomicrobiales bacterium]|nr:SDR family oxidoreductase [Thermomicrobiales bacterium]